MLPSSHLCEKFAGARHNSESNRQSTAFGPCAACGCGNAANAELVTKDVGLASAKHIERERIVRELRGGISGGRRIRDRGTCGLPRRCSGLWLVLGLIDFLDVCENTQKLGARRTTAGSGRDGRLVSVESCHGTSM